MANPTRYPLVPADAERDTVLGREYVARWIPVVVPLLAVLMVLILAAIIGGVL